MIYEVRTLPKKLIMKMQRQISEMVQHTKKPQITISNIELHCCKERKIQEQTEQVLLQRKEDPRTN
jgi:hypothetical protein